MNSLVETLGLPATAGVTALVAYVALCKGLRYVRQNQKHAQFPYKTRDDFKNMTGEDAFEIIKYVQGLEFPFMGITALQFALFK